MEFFQLFVDVVGIRNVITINEKKAKGEKKFAVSCGGHNNSSVHSLDVAFLEGNITSRAGLDSFSSA